MSRLRPTAERFLTVRTAALRARGIEVRLIDPFDVVHERGLGAPEAARSTAPP